jgi:membrane protease YdiL (CAAX protease family)
MRERLTRSDWRLLAICAAIFAGSLWVILNWFSAAFPEASIEFRFDRSTSRTIAEKVLRAQAINIRDMKHSAVFSDDDTAKLFLERTLGLGVASTIMQRDVHLWFWHHRWFQPLQEEELSVDIAPTGELVSFVHRIPEARALPALSPDASRAMAEHFLASNAISGLRFVSFSERNLPHRTQRIFTWEAQAIRPGGAPYRHTVTIDGNVVGEYSQRLRVPDQWQRDYRELRSKNLAAGNVDTLFFALTGLALLIVFIVRLLRGNLRLKMLLAIGAITFVLNVVNSLNAFPMALSGYDTTSSYSAFLAQLTLGTLLQSLGLAMLLVVIAGAGEVLYRQRLPQHLALPKLWTPHSLTSRRVFRSFILGYTMVAFFVAYQVAFYLIAGRFGAWSPAEIPYDDILNTSLPWVAVLFAGWFPAMSEELMSRAFSIPLLERLLRSRIAAIVISGFIWGFGHATYPNQPFFIRGLEVGLAGVLLGFLWYRFGLLPLLIWHYTVDALYTALLLFRSHNTYYIVSAAAAVLIFVFPMLLSIVLYWRNGGFVPDHDLTNATLPVSEPPVKSTPEPEPVSFPSPVRTSATAVVLAVVSFLLIAWIVWQRQTSLDDAIDYRITANQAKAIARLHLITVAHQPIPSRVIAAPIDGFRNWDRASGREDGGGAGGYDSVAADYLIRHGMTVRRLVAVFRERIEAGTWTVRFFTPSQKVELFVEVDPRTSRVIGYHKYQDEKAAGSRLQKVEAEAIAIAAFQTYGASPASFDLKEALTFEQPARRDWLFHFQERQPLGADAWRRITIRVSGNEVTQFATTVKIPDSVYREDEQQTLLTVVFALIRILGIIGALALIIIGVIAAWRNGTLHWRRAAIGAGAFLVFPLIAIPASWDLRLFGYNTSVQWQTFFVDQIVDIVRSVGLQGGLLFLAVAALDAAFPYAFSLLSREGRSRFGRAAIVSATTILAILGLLRFFMEWVASRFPSLASAPSFNAPDDVAILLPGVLTVGQAAFDALIASAAVAMFALALRTLTTPSAGDPLTESSTDSLHERQTSHRTMVTALSRSESCSRSRSTSTLQRMALR